MWPRFLTLFGALCSSKIVKYGDLVTLTHVPSGHMLHSLTKIQWARGGQIVTVIPDELRGDDYGPVTWTIRAPVNNTNVPSAARVAYFSTQSRANKNGTEVFGAKSAGAPVRCGEKIRLEHAESGLVLTVLDQKTQITGGLELVGLPQRDVNDTFEVGCSDEFWTIGNAATLKHNNQQYIGVNPSAVYTNYNCQRCPMKKHVEVSVARHTSSRASWTANHILNINNSFDEVFDDDEFESTSDDEDPRDEL